MFSVRGLALMSRLEYIENKFGIVKYKEFLKKISNDDINFSRQPVDAAHIYSDNILAEIDRILLEEYLDNNVDEFYALGKWNADNFVYRYFSLYVENSEPYEFLIQYSRLRDFLLGSGEMEAQRIDNNRIALSIDYGQAISKSICLSEQGFIEGGLEQCGAKNIEIKESVCASVSEAYKCEFEISFK